MKTTVDDEYISKSQDLSEAKGQHCKQKRNKG